MQGPGCGRTEPDRCTTPGPVAVASRLDPALRIPVTSAVMIHSASWVRQREAAGLACQAAVTPLVPPPTPPGPDAENPQGCARGGCYLLLGNCVYGRPGCPIRPVAHVRVNSNPDR
jgi:hypothetical protein